MNVKKARINRLTLGITLLLTITATAFRKGDFPNYFHTDGQDTALVEHKVEQAMTSILRRLRVPYVNEKGQILKEGFFAAIEQRAKSHDKDAEVFISGGVVRSLLGYIYQKVKDAKEKPNLQRVPTTIEILDNIISGKKGDTEKDVSSLAALGISSDVDILVKSKNGKSEEIKKDVTGFINSVEKKLALTGEGDRLKKAVVPIGDVNDYDEQTNEAVLQGGSNLDWLAFPISGGKMVTPEQHKTIFSDFIRGTYSYLPNIEDPGSKFFRRHQQNKDAQAVRGLRALLEIPFLTLDAAGEKQLGDQLEAVLKNLNEGGTLTPKALEQLDKLMRNARFQGAKNRFYITPQSEPTRVERLAFEISEQVAKGEKKLRPVREFIKSENINNREKKADRCGLQKTGRLMEKTEFVEKHTDKGNLLHGTPRVDNVLDMIRNGFYRSTEKQGTAAMGEGFYTTKDRTLAESYAQSGVVLELKVKEDDRIRILSWDTTPVSTQNSIKAEATRLNMDPFRYLSEKCDVDIIVHNYPLIQNAWVLQREKSAKPILEARLYPTLKLIEKSETPEEKIKLLDSIQDYGKYYQLAEILGVTGLKEPPDFDLLLVELMKHSDPKVRERAASYLGEYSGKGFELFEAAFENPDPKVRALAVDKFSKHQYEIPGPILEKFLSTPNPDAQKAVAQRLIKYSGSDASRFYKKLFRGQNAEVKIAALSSLDRYNGPKKAELLAIALRDSNPKVLDAGMNVLFDLPANQKTALYKEILERAGPIAVRAVEQLEYLEGMKPEDKRLLFELAATSPNSEVAKAFFNYRLVGQPEAKGLIGTGIKNPDTEVKVAAISVLSLYQGDDRDQLLDLALKDGNKAAGEAAVQALNSIWRYGIDQQHSSQVKEALRHSEPGVRKRAVALLLPRYKESDRESLLSSALTDSAPEVRAAALGVVDQKHAHLLKPLLRDTSPDVRKQAVSLLHLLNDDERKEHLLKALEDEVSSVRKKAFQQVDLKSHQDVRGLLSRALNDSAPKIRLMGLEALEDSKVDHPEKLLEHALKDSDLRVRAKAVSLLYGLRDPSQKAFVQKAFTEAMRDPDVNVRKEAVGEHHPDQSIEELERVLNDDPDEEVRERALRPLLTHEPRRAMELGLKNSSEEVRRSIRYELNRYYHDDKGKVLEHFLQNQDAEVRRSAANQLHRYEHDDKGILLKQALQDSDPEIRKIAADEIKKYKGADQASLLELALRHSDPGVGVVASEGLKKYRGEKTEALLKIALQHPAVEVRRVAAGCIEDSGIQDKHALLKIGLDDEDWQVGSTTARSLSGYQGPGLSALIHQCLRPGSGLESHGIEAIISLQEKEKQKELLQEVLAQKELALELFEDRYSHLPEVAFELGLAANRADHPDLRRNMAKSLSMCKGNCLPFFETLLSDPDPGVQAAAVRYFSELSIDQIKSPHFQGLFRKALSSQHPEVQMAASPLLVRSMDPAAFELALNSQNEEIRENAIKSLGWYGGDRLASLLFKAISDPNPEFRKMALKHMGRLQGSSENIKELESMGATKIVHKLKNICLNEDQKTSEKVGTLLSKIENTETRIEICDGLFKESKGNGNILSCILPILNSHESEGDRLRLIAKLMKTHATPEERYMLLYLSKMYKKDYKAHFPKDFKGFKTLVREALAHAKKGVSGDCETQGSFERQSELDSEVDRILIEVK